MLIVLAIGSAVVEREDVVDRTPKRVAATPASRTGSIRTARAERDDDTPRGSRLSGDRWGGGFDD